MSRWTLDALRCDQSNLAETIHRHRIESDISPPFMYICCRSLCQPFLQPGHCDLYVNIGYQMIIIHCQFEDELYDSYQYVFYFEKLLAPGK